MKFNPTSRNAVALAALMVLAAFAAPFAAAAPTVDTTTSPSTQTSEVTDGSSYDNFNASGSIGWLNASYDSDNPGLALIDPATGEVVKSFGASSSRWTEYDAANNSYAINLTEEDFATMPMDASEQKNVTLRMDGNTSNSSSALYTNITITLNNTDERAVVRAGSTAESSDLVEIDEDEPGTLASIFGAEASNISTLEADSVGIAGDNTTVYVVYADDGVAESYEAAADSKSRFFGLSSADYEDGDQIKDHILTVEGTYYGVYSGAAPEDAESPEDHTYATYETLNGEPVHVINLGTDYEDETSVDVRTTGNDTPGFTTDIQELDTGGLLGFMTVNGGSGLLAA